MQKEFLFPFESVKNGSNIAIYGAGVVGQRYYEQCITTKYCNVIYWIDRNYANIRLHGTCVDICDIESVDEKRIDYFIIAIENPTIKDDIQKSIEGIIPLNKIVWRNPNVLVTLTKESQNTATEIRAKAYKLENILPERQSPYPVADWDASNENNIKLNNGKIKIRFFYEAIWFWNCMKSLIKACINDNRFDVLVVGCACERPPKYTLRKDNACDIGARYVNDIEYDIQNDKPDVAIVGIMAPYMKDLIRNHSKIVYAIYGGVVKYTSTETAKIFYDSVKKQLGPMNPDYYIWDKLVYDQIVEEKAIDEKCILIGNPKFDDILFDMNKDIFYPDGWGKLRGKKVVLWATDHNYTNPNVSFDVYAKSIFEFFSDNKDMGCIFRPHGLLFRELIRNGVWSEDDLAEFTTFFDVTDNMVYDERQHYDCAYRICDAVLTDVNCGIACTSLPLGVPVAAMLRPEGTPVREPILFESMYPVNSVNELYEFFEMVRNGEDPKKDIRNNAMKKSIHYYDGKIGERIKEFILNTYH